MTLQVEGGTYEHPYHLTKALHRSLTALDMLPHILKAQQLAIQKSRPGHLLLFCPYVVKVYECSYNTKQ